MHKSKDDDLFKESTMTFGEHLEELRGALFKAVIGLAIGCSLGLYFGKDMVKIISRPLVAGLKDYYRTKAEIEYTDWEQEQVDAGLKPPYTLEQVREIAKGDPAKGIPELIYDVRYVHAGTILPDAEGNVGVPLTRDALRPLLMWQPIDTDTRIDPSAMGVPEAFGIWIKASLVLGVVLSSPWVFYQIWAFVAAGLYPHEKKYVHIFLPASLGLFLSGVAIAYFFVFGPVLSFLFEFNQSMGINPDPRISEWLGFVLLLPIGFGVSFQLPLIMLFMERIGILDANAYLEKWRIAVLVIFVAAAVLTPSFDPYSMLLMAIPLTGLYFGGWAMCKYLPRHKPE